MSRLRQNLCVVQSWPFHLNVTELLKRLGLSLYQQRLVENGFDSLECLYGITEHDFDTLDIEGRDRRTLLQELQRCEAQDGPGDLAASLNTSPAETSASDEPARFVSYQGAESASHTKVFNSHGNMHCSLVEGPYSEDWGYLINTSDSSSLPILLRKKRPSTTLNPTSNSDSHATHREQERSQSNRNSTGGYLIGSHPGSVDGPSISNPHCVIFWVNNSAGGMAAVEDLSAKGTAVNGVILGQNTSIELHGDDEGRVDDKAHFLFQYSIHKIRIFREHYTIMGNVGKGHFATVFSCTEKATEVEYAVKIVKKQDKDKERAIRQEIGLLMSVCHRSIILLQDVFEDPENIFLVLEFASEGELFRHIALHGKLAETIVRGIAVQLLQALKYLHERRIVHRDIKLENILVIDKGYSVKLADFGLAKVIGDHSYATELLGTPSYMPPEILEEPGRRKYSNSVDVWSLRVVLYICLCGFPPFSNELCTPDNPYGLFEQIKLGLFGYPSPYWDHIDDVALEFLDRMLTVDVLNRIKVDEALLHQWITVDDGSFRQGLPVPQTSQPNFLTRRSTQDRALLSEAVDAEVPYLMAET